jgi:hypothetical protein
MKTGTMIDSRQALRQWVADQLTGESDATAGTVTEYLANRRDRPEWDTDWSEWLERLDLWHIATGLGL